MPAQASGWGIVIGFGAFFAIFAGSLVYLDIAFSGEVRGVLHIAHRYTSGHLFSEALSRCNSYKDCIAGIQQ